ncbi:MAG: class I SAM-dependent methyltransferase [Candidatus Paceibacterota bacterium]
MRRCPVCNSDKRLQLWRSDFLVPDNWKRPDYIDWFRCECGMLYGDHPTITQQDYDWYYTEKYGYGVVDEANQKRLKDRADYISGQFDKDIKIVDFGGGDSGLSMFLRSNGFYNVSVYGCGQEMPGNVDVIVSEHVLEHIYDMNDAMDKISKSLKAGGTLIVDIPDATSMALERPLEMPILDFTQVHINHFRMIDMLRLMERYGFELQETHEYHERHGGCRMFVFVKDSTVVSCNSQWFVIRNMAEKLTKLKELVDRPVVIWGYGDICAHLLARYWPNVQYFVCNDPAYIGETINGLPVYEKKPYDTFTVLVIAQSQKGKLVDRIKLECENEIIVI